METYSAILKMKTGNIFFSVLIMHNLTTYLGRVRTCLDAIESNRYQGVIEVCKARTFNYVRCLCTDYNLTFELNLDNTTYR